MKGKENQRIVITKRMLWEALCMLLEKKHINDVSVTELCAAASINRATFYKHYSTPNDILAEVGQAHAESMMKIQREGEGVRPAEQIIEESCEYMYRYRDIVRLLMKNGMDSEMSMKAMVGLLKQMNLPSLIDMDGFDEIEKQLLLSYIASGCYSIIKQWLMDDLPKTPREIASIIYRLSSRGWIRLDEMRG